MEVIKLIREKQRDKVRQDPDIKDKKGTQPDVYYKGLKKSTKDKRDAHFKKGAKMDDDNPAAYKPAPGDATAKTKPSKHTKKFNQMYGENMEEGKLVANFREILDTMMNQIKKEVGKRYQRSEESGVDLMNRIGSIVGYKVTNKAQQKNKLFLKFGDEIVKEDLAPKDVGYLIKRYRELDKLQNRLIRIRGADNQDMKKCRDAVREAKFAIMDLVEGNADVIVDEYDPTLSEGNTGLHFQYEKVDIKKALKKVRGVTKQQAEIIASIPQPTLISLIQQLSTLASEKEVEESLWRNIHNKRKRGERMRKPGEKGAPKPGDFKRARGEDLDHNSDAGDYIDDFMKSDAPQFKNKSTKKIRKMAIAAYLDSKEKK